MWKGTISFGLVNIPVNLYNAIDTSQKISFNQLDSKGHRMQYKKWCSVEEREVPDTEIKRGYELAKNKYVVIEKQDLEKIAIESTRTITIKEGAVSIIRRKELLHKFFIGLGLTLYYQ